MDLNATLALSLKLRDVVLARAAMIEAGAKLTDFDVMALDKRSRILAADLDAAWKEPQPVDPWTPHNQRNSIRAYKPGAAS